MKILLLVVLFVLVGCVFIGGVGVFLVDVSGVDIFRCILDNGDIVEEYWVSGQFCMVKVMFLCGFVYYMYDCNGDGCMDNDKDGVLLVYWKFYSW